jgi:CheY-like chemotaxis protein
VSRILVVDDDVHVQETLARDLRVQSYDVGIAASFDEAVAALNSAPAVDVMLTDLRMPGRDGLDLLHETRRLSPNTRTVLMSAFATAKDYEAAVALGTTSVLCKPFTRSQLRTAVRQALECGEGFRGRVHGIGLVDLLQMLHFARRSTSLSVRGDVEGKIELRNGEIIHAATDDAIGEDALGALLATPTGFVHTSPPEGDPPPTIFMPFDMLLLEMLRRIDELARGPDSEDGASVPFLLSNAPRFSSRLPLAAPVGGLSEVSASWFDECRNAGAIAETAGVYAVSLVDDELKVMQGEPPDDSFADDVLTLVADARAMCTRSNWGGLELLRNGTGLSLVWSVDASTVLVMIDEVHEGSPASRFRWRAAVMARTIAERCGASVH